MSKIETAPVIHPVGGGFTALANDMQPVETWLQEEQRKTAFFYNHARSAIDTHDTKAIEEIYDRARRTVRFLMRPDAQSEIIYTWRDAFNRVSAYAESKSATPQISTLINRLDSAAHYLNDNIYCQRYHNSDELFSRRSSVRIIKLLHGANRPIKAEFVERITNYSPSNLNRIVAILETAGLVGRVKPYHLTLTAEGRVQFERRNPTASTTPQHPSPV